MKMASSTRQRGPTRVSVVIRTPSTDATSDRIHERRPAQDHERKLIKKVKDLNGNSEQRVEGPYCVKTLTRRPADDHDAAESK